MTPAEGPLARLRAQLAGPRGPQRVDALLASDDPAEAVAALSPTELHELVVTVGLDEAGPLLQLATPAQIQGCIDFESWDRDRADLAMARPWFAAILELGFEKLGQVWAGLDPEWRVLFIQSNIIVYDLYGGEDPDHDSTYLDVPDDDAPPVWMTPDGAFAVRLLGSHDEARLSMQILDDLYRADMGLARHTLLSARSEPTASLEETSYRWRNGRLADLGYVDFYDALELFAPLTPEQFLLQAPPPDSFVDDADHGGLPLSIAEKIVARSFLARAWDRVPSAAHEALEMALIVLVNKVLAAARVKPGDPAAVALAADYATCTVALGLETVTRGDLDRAAALLPTASMTRLHRVGFTITQQLARVAKGLAPRTLTADDAATAVVSALCAPRPWMARVLDDPPRPGVRPFESPADLRRVAEVLATLALRLTVAEALGISLASMKDVPEPRPQLDDHVRTALGRVLAGGDLTPDALSLGEAAAARRALDADGPAAWAPRALAAIRAALVDRGGDGGLGTRLGALVDQWLSDLVDALAPLDLAHPDEFDGRFVAGVMVAAGARA